MRECPLASVSDGNDVIEEMNEKLEAPIFLDSAIGMLLYCCCCCFHLHPHNLYTEFQPAPLSSEENMKKRNVVSRYSKVTPSFIKPSVLNEALAGAGAGSSGSCNSTTSGNTTTPGNTDNSMDTSSSDNRSSAGGALRLKDRKNKKF